MKGRGGAGFCASCTGSDATGLLVVGGFVGEESNDVYRFDFETGRRRDHTHTHTHTHIAFLFWNTMNASAPHLCVVDAGKWQVVLPPGNSIIRPFSVSCSALLHAPGTGDPVVVFFGGEIDPSDKGHEGAGNFSNALLVRAK